MKNNYITVNINHVTSINYCCSEIMASVMDLTDKQYNKLFRELCKILKTTPKEMSKRIVNNTLLGSGVIK